jgi:3-hydroxyacyl-CoA dehydrogenase/enoyl-CoA hydratase/3-hydroxybutyryl-CoA epimerase
VAYVKAIGKTPVVVKDGPGFLVNRLLLPWLNEAGHCLAEGYDILETDFILKKFGMPMGPFELLDEIGLDVACKVSHILHQSLGERFAPSDVLDKIVEANKKNDANHQRLGKKSGLGFYRWENGKRQDLDEEEIDNIVHNSHTQHISPNADELLARLRCLTCQWTQKHRNSCRMPRRSAGRWCRETPQPSSRNPNRPRRAVEPPQRRNREMAGRGSTQTTERD